MPATHNLTINQGENFEQRLVWKDSNAVPVDLTGYTARMQIRRTVKSPEFLYELTTENDGIVLGGAAGTVLLQIPAATTAGFTFRSGVYDLELVPANGKVKRLLQGEVELSPEVTR